MAIEPRIDPRTKCAACDGDWKAHVAAYLSRIWADDSRQFASMLNNVEEGVVHLDNAVFTDVDCKRANDLTEAIFIHLPPDVRFIVNGFPF